MGNTSLTNLVIRNFDLCFVEKLTREDFRDFRLLGFKRSFCFHYVSVLDHFIACYEMFAQLRYFEGAKRAKKPHAQPHVGSSGGQKCPTNQHSPENK